MRLRWLTNTAIALVIGLFVLSCSDEIAFGGPLDVEVSANSPIPVGDSLQLDYDVVGRNLLGMVVVWGDNESDSVFFSGAQSAGGRVAHLYAEAGSYALTARVMDQVEGSQTKALTVTVDP